MYSTCRTQAGDYLGAFVQQRWVLLSEVLFPSFPVAGVAASLFFFLLVVVRKQRGLCLQAGLC